MAEQKTNASGVGLVEVLVVLGLLGVMAGGAVPGMHRINQEWALLGGTRLVEGSLLWARTHAISANDSLIFVIDEDGRRFYWLGPDGSRFESSVRYMPAGIRITSSPRKPLRFYQHGNAAPSGTFVVEGAAGIYRVVVSVLGRIRVQRDK
jgi:Tfp pilus assembly protein FimT